MDNTNENQPKLLHAAVRIGDYNLLKTLLNKGVNIVETNFKGDTPLHIAIAFGTNPFFVKKLFQNGLTIDVANYRGESLFLAVQNTCNELANLLLNKGASADAKNYADETPLHIAVSLNRFKIVETLIKKGATLDIRNYKGETPMDIAAKNYRFGIVNILLDRGAHLDLKVHQDLFHKAVEFNKVELISKLLSEVNKKNLVGEVALHVAVRFNRYELVETLIKSNAKLNVKNYKGEMPLDLAATKGNLKMVEILLDQGGELDCNQHKTLLHQVVKHGCVALVEKLLNCGIDVNMKDLNGETALHVAAASGRMEMMNRLLDSGADIDAENIQGETALFYAFRHQSTRVLETLLARGASFDNFTGFYCIWNNTFLHYAVEKNSLSLVKILLQRGCPIDVKNSQGETPLHLAANKGYTDIINILIDLGADLNAVCKYSNTPLHTAVASRSILAINLLLEKGADVDSKTSSESPLYTAVSNYDSESAIVLLNHGASLEIDSGETSVDFLCNYEHSNFQKLNSPTLHHILKLITAGLTTSRTLATDSIRRICEKIYNHEKLEELYCQELDIIRNTRVFENNKLSIVFAQWRKPYYIENSELVASIQELLDCPNLINMFPNYANILKCTFNHSKMVYNLMYLSLLSFSWLLRNSLSDLRIPSEIMFKIIEMLDDSAKCQLIKTLLHSPSDFILALPSQIQKDIAKQKFTLKNQEITKLLRSCIIKLDAAE